MKVVAILHKSAGNETVGEMWRETKIFELDTPVGDIFKWAQEQDIELHAPLKGHLEITIT